MLIEEILNRTRAVVREIVAPRCEAEDRDAQWPRESLRAFQAAGLGGLLVPVAAGGLGHGMSTLARVCEEIAMHSPSTAICWGMHHVGAAVIAAKATAEQTERILVPIAKGEHLTTLALSEPGTGSHFYFPETKLARQNDGGFAVSGRKSFVTNGGHVDSYVVSTVAVGDEASIGRFSCVVIPHDARGLVWGPPWAGLGMRGNSSRDLELRDVAVPSHDLLGAEGDQIWYVFNVVAPFFLTAMSATYLGLAAAALEEARAHVGARSHAHTGAKLAHNAIIQHRLGELWSKVTRTRALIHYAAAAGDAGAPDALPALCSAKAEVAECAVDVANEAMTLLGGRGYGAHSRIERMLRDARAAHVMAPTTDVLRTWVGRSILDLPLLAE